MIFELIYHQNILFQYKRQKGLTKNDLFAVAGDVCGKMNDPILNINDSGKNLEDKRLVSSMITN